MIPTDRLRQDALGIFQSALAAVDPGQAVREALVRKDGALWVGDQRFGLGGFEHIYVVGAGKASAAMAAALEEILGDALTAGRVTTKYGHGLPLDRVAVVEAGHPLPDQAGMNGAREIMTLLERATARDLVIALLSGGASALMPLPVGDLSLDEKQTATRVLLHCGAEIVEINTIRKHLSRIKGGRLAARSAPAALLCLVISDVIGDPLESIASGPTVGDPTTYGDCLAILDRYDLKGKMPPRVLAHLNRGAKGEVGETPKPGDPELAHVHNHIIASNRRAVAAAAAEAAKRGYRTQVLSTFVAGETREVARMHGAVAREIRASGRPLASPACIISGGETTVTVKGSGLGGRNQEFALAGALEIDGLAHTVIFSAGTDGSDGPTDAAGGLVDGTTISRAVRQGLDAVQYLKNNDAYNFLKPLGDLMVSGPTLTNVMDLHLVLVG